MAPQPPTGARHGLSYAKAGIGCLLSPILTLGFYGATAIVFVTLIVYPFIYAQDASSANAYKTATACGESVGNDCLAQVNAVVSNVRSAGDQPEFDVVLGGKTVTVTKDSGAYSPQNGDSVQLEMWRGQPVRVIGPGGAEMNTDQHPGSRLKTDQDVLGVFLVAGFFCLIVAVLIGWFGRRIVFERFIGYSRPQILGGCAIALVIVIVTVPVLIVGQASGWLPQGRFGGTILGFIVGGLILLASGVYALIRRLRSA